MVSIPKISIGKKAKRNFFDLTHDVNTTSDFGFCQPTICREFYKDSKITLQTKEFVRLGAMPCPTFGRIEVKTHTAFVPVRETFLAYDYLQAQKTVTSANRSYIPQCSDYVTANTLLGSLMDLAVDYENYFYNYHVGEEYEAGIDNTRFIGRFSLWTKWSKFCPSNYEKYSLHSPNDWVDIVNDSVIATDQKLANNSVRLLASVLSVDPSVVQQTNSPLYNFLGNPQHFNKAYFGKLDTVNGTVRQTVNKLYMLNFGEYVPNRVLPQYNTMYPDASYSRELALSYMYFPEHNPEFMQALGPADFSFGETEIVGYTDEWEQSITGVPIRIKFHLSRTGRRLLKVFTGCRISFGTKNKKIDLMRLFSYYKVWFDKYNPGRNLQWLDTNCFGLIHGYYDYGSILDNILLAVGQDYQRVFNAGIVNRYRAFWYKFVIDLAQCCYVLPIDNMTCATPTPLLEIDNNVSSLNSVGLYPNNLSPDEARNADVKSNTVYGDGTGYFMKTGGLGIQLLDRIYHLVNKNSVIGSKIDEYLKAHNISRGLPKSNVLGDTKFMCNIDDVFATAATEESALGQYAGKGIGSGSSEKMHFECESFGYLIQILCVVPLGGYVQGMRDCPINRYDFYQEEFDSLGMEPMSLSNFINRRYDYDTFKTDDSVFGFRPRYFGLKIENNLANGGFALRSQQTQFLPYCLDRLFSISGDSSMVADVEDYVPDEELRYIGRYEKFGNYDRIFYDTTGLTENFIVHMIQDFSMYAPMKSISDSYDTFDKDVDDAAINVQKA